MSVPNNNSKDDFIGIPQVVETFMAAKMIVFLKTCIFSVKNLSLINKILHGPPFKLAGFLKQISPAFSEATDSCNTGILLAFRIGTSEKAAATNKVYRLV